MEVERYPEMDSDIVSTCREKLQKFIRELHRLTTYVKILTDSTTISFDAWYHFLLDKVYNIDMPIKHEKFDMIELIKADQFGDRSLRPMIEYVDPPLDYDFYKDEVIEVQRMQNMFKVIPQDSLKYSIINTIAYVCSDLVVDYLREYTKLTGSYSPDKECKMVIK